MELDHDSPVPLYRQIADLLRADIERGTYEPGATIPAVSTIIQETGCTHVTVRKGIKVLADEGLVVVVPGKGTFVARRGQWAQDAAGSPSAATGPVIEVKDIS